LATHSKSGVEAETSHVFFDLGVSVVNVVDSMMFWWGGGGVGGFFTVSNAQKTYFPH
jgi:hypothetical protein